MIQHRRSLSFWLLWAVAACGACEVDLRGVPIRTEHDAGADEDASSPGEDGGSLADEDSGSLADEDSGAPGDDPHRTYDYDFDQPDGPVRPLPCGRAECPEDWAVQGSGVAEVWDERLCFEGDVRVRLRIRPGAHRYVRVDVPAQSNLMLRALGVDDETLFDVSWQDTAVSREDGPDVVLDTGAAGNEVWPVARQLPYTTKRYEFELDFVARRITAHAEGEPAQTTYLSDLIAAESLTALEFFARWQEGVACVDNVYVAERAPESDPFAGAHAVNACVPISADVRGRCVSANCCDEAARVFAAQCWESCAGESCPCSTLDPLRCVSECVRTHPSESASDCTDLCRLRMERVEAASALVRCADDCGGWDPQPLLPEPAPAPLPERSPPADPEKRLRMELDPANELGQLVEITLGTTVRQQLASLPVLPGDLVKVYGEPSHLRTIALVSTSVSSPFLDSGSVGRVFVRDANVATDKFGSGFVQVALPQSAQKVEPSESGRYAWVETVSQHHGWTGIYLLRGTTVLAHEDGAHVLEYGFGPDDRYAWWTLVDDKAVVYDFLAGQIYRLQLADADGWWNAGFTFDDSIAWLDYSSSVASWSWRHLDGTPVAASLPDAELSFYNYEREAGFLTGDSKLYAKADTGLSPVATLPAGFEQGQWSPVISSAARALYFVNTPWAEDGSTQPRVSNGLVLADLAGNRLASFSPALRPAPPPEGSEAYVTLGDVRPFDPSHGVFAVAHGVRRPEELYAQTYATELVAFALEDSEGVSLVSLGEVPDGTPLPQLFTRPDSSLYVVEDGDGLPVLFDVATQAYRTYHESPEDGFSWVWAEYPAPLSLYMRPWTAD